MGIDNLDTEGRKMLANLSLDEKVYLKQHCRNDISNLVHVTDAEKGILKEIGSGVKRKYRMELFKITGKLKQINLQLLYNEVLAKNEILRSVYIQGALAEPLRVVYTYANDSFPIRDVSTLPFDSKMSIVENVIAVQTRREYNPGKSRMLELQAFMVRDEEYIVICSLHQHFCSEISISKIISDIFRNYVIDRLGMDDFATKVDYINDEIRERCFKFWQPIFTSHGKKLLIPGELVKDKSGERESVSKAISGDAVDNICKYCYETGISLRTLIIGAWGKLLGEANDEDNPMVFCSGKGEKMFLYPVRTDRNCTDEALVNIHNTMELYPKYSACSWDEISATNNNRFSKWLHAVLTFIDMRKITSLDDIAMVGNSYTIDDGMDFDVPLRIYVRMSAESIGFNYVYDNEKFYGAGIERLHNMLIQIVNSIISRGKNVFEEKAFVQTQDMTAEERRKYQILQTIELIKRSNIVFNCSDIEIRRIAEEAVVRRYSPGDYVVRSGDVVESVGLICNGVVEECRNKEDGTVRTVCLKKSRSLILMECLSNRNKARFDYVVQSDMAVILWLKKESLLELFRISPESAFVFLEDINNTANKMKTLWTLVD